MTEWKTNTKEFLKQVEHAVQKPGRKIITLTKLNARAKDCFYSFRFQPEDKLIKVGDIIKDNDLSISRIEAIL